MSEQDAASARRLYDSAIRERNEARDLLGEVVGAMLFHDIDLRMLDADLMDRVTEMVGDKPPKGEKRGREG